jgi:hypothetical protein
VARIALGAAVGGAVTTATIVAGQYANGDDFGKATGIPDPFGAAFFGGVAGLAAAGTGAWHVYENGHQWGYSALGVGVGITASTFLVTPVIRRYLADH